MGEFRHFLLLEQENFLAQKIGDVLTALQSAAEDSPNLGNRQLISIATNIVDEMRKILEGRWSQEEQGYLKTIQNAAVAIAKAIDSNEKMADVISTAKTELEALSGRLGAPVHDLGTDVEEGKGSRAEDQS